MQFWMLVICNVIQRSFAGKPNFTNADKRMLELGVSLAQF